MYIYETKHLLYSVCFRHMAEWQIKNVLTFSNASHCSFYFLKILSVDSKMSVGCFWRTCPSTENLSRQTTAKRPSPKVDLTSMTAVTAMTDTYCYVWYHVKNIGQTILGSLMDFSFRNFSSFAR